MAGTFLRNRINAGVGDFPLHSIHAAHMDKKPHMGSAGIEQILGPHDIVTVKVNFLFILHSKADTGR